MRASAAANANLAIVKYWGKRDERLILPMHGSISLTLRGLQTMTTVDFDAGLAQDEVRVNEEAVTGRVRLRVEHLLDLVRRMAGTGYHAAVTSENTFPTAAGLASSASAFAALALAASRAAGLRLDGPALSRLARQGSGSACRSVYDGFVEWVAGDAADGSDSFAVRLKPLEHWDLAVVIAIVATAEKTVSSSEGMRRSVDTSPFYAAWRGCAVDDLRAARQAIEDRDFSAFGELCEENALRMHATALAARPPVVYWTPGTLAVLRAVQALRQGGLEAYASMDAGANVHLLVQPESVDLLRAEISRLPEVSQVLVSGPGPGARLLGKA